MLAILTVLQFVATNLIVFQEITLELYILAFKLFLCLGSFCVCGGLVGILYIGSFPAKLLYHSVSLLTFNLFVSPSLENFPVF